MKEKVKDSVVILLDTAIEGYPSPPSIRSSASCFIILAFVVGSTE